jgi:elongation factor G
MKAYTFPADGSGTMTEGPVPAAMDGRGRRGRPRGADRDGGRGRRAADGEVLRGRHADAGGAGRGLARPRPPAKIFPLVCASGLQNIGIQPLLDAILAYLPSPADRPFSGPRAMAGGEAARGRREGALRGVRLEDGGRPVRGPHHDVPRLPGRSRPTRRSQPHAGTQERLGHLLVLQGKTQTNVPEITAGDLGAVAKLKDTRTNDTLADKGAGITFAPIEFPNRCSPTPSSRRAAATRTRSAPRCTGSRKRTRRSATCRDPQTKELLLSGQGQLHIEVTVAKLKRRFGVEVNLKPPRIPYRETITARPRRTAAQEADGRPRAVRRLQDPDGAAAARRRLRVRGRHLRRLDPATVHPGGREGHPGGTAARLPGRLPGGGLPRDVWSTGSTTTWTRTSCRSRWRAAGLQGRMSKAGRRCSSRS